MARFREGTGTGLLVALGSLSIYSLFAWVLVVLLWIALSVYALVEMIGDGRPSPVAVLLIVVLLVGTLVTLAAVGIGYRGEEPHSAEARPRLTPGPPDALRRGLHHHQVEDAGDRQHREQAGRSGSGGGGLVRGGTGFGRELRLAAERWSEEHPRDHPDQDVEADRDRDPERGEPEPVGDRGP